MTTSTSKSPLLVSTFTLYRQLLHSEIRHIQFTTDFDTQYISHFNQKSNTDFDTQYTAVCKKVNSLLLWTLPLKIIQRHFTHKKVITGSFREPVHQIRLQHPTTLSPLLQAQQLTNCNNTPSNFMSNTSQTATALSPLLCVQHPSFVSNTSWTATALSPALFCVQHLMNCNSTVTPTLFCVQHLMNCNSTVTPPLSCPTPHKLQQHCLCLLCPTPRKLQQLSP